MAIKDHLVILVHGLWGSPVHLEYLAEQVKKHDERLVVFVPTTNKGYFTYDGIDTCAERIVREVEKALVDFRNEGGIEIKKISVVGYSLGGLIARYLVGLMYANGTFDRFTPVNFTTFATPNLGVLSPNKTLFYKYVWNFVGPRTISRSGQQMFLSDTFRDTNKPLLLVMTDKTSIFHKGLSAFSKRSLYANCVNDRVVPFFTASISTFDPFHRPHSSHSLSYLPNYSPNILTYPTCILSPPPPSPPKPLKTRIQRKAKSLAKFTPLITAGVIVFPLALIAFVANAVVQNSRSGTRIKEHGDREAESEIRKFGLFLSEEVQDVVETVLDIDNSIDSASESGETLTNTPDKSTTALDPSLGESESDSFLKKPDTVAKEEEEEDEEGKRGVEMQLGPEQAEMERSLNSLQWEKFPVYIHGEKHSHAAIIVRKGTDYRWGKNEGVLVVRHWLKEVFIL